MHFAFPPRKTSQPPPYAHRTTYSNILRRSRAKTLAIGAVVIFAVFFLFSRIFGGSDHVEAGAATEAVIVTVLQPEMYSKEYIENIKQNRIEYAKRHGYAVFLVNSTDYDLNGAPASWAKVPAARHAMAKWPASKYVWVLNQNSLIMNPDRGIYDNIMEPERLELIMQKDVPIVPPESVIKTFGNLKGSQIDFVLCQSREGLDVGSFILRTGEWSKFFLDTWFDPLYRSYNFQKADTHALEHIVQWHPTILSKLAIIPQRYLSAYGNGENDQSRFKPGDLVVRFPTCDLSGQNTCEVEAEQYARSWQTVFRASR